jgi:hypothetical protein
MSRNVPAPFFPVAPPEYDQRYLAEVVRAFSLFVQQSQNPGDSRATNLTLTNLQEDDFGLEPGALFQQNGFVKICLSNVPHPRGVSATAQVGAVSVTIT